MARYAWFLNFDADDELSSPVGYTAKRSTLDRVESLRARVGDLVGPDDVVLDDPPHRLDDTFEGRAWCPTPRAIRALRAANVIVPDVPSLEVLRRVNHRRFNAELGQTLPGACFVDTWDALLRVVSSATDSGQWLVKRPFGFAGRGRRKVRQGDVDASTRPWLEASLATGEGLQVEPWVERVLDVALHGIVDRDGPFRLGRPTLQRVDEHGQWIETVLLPPDTLTAVELDALALEARSAATALHEAGYFGPFGIDAFRHRARDGVLVFDPRCEINARYSMGWAVGMAAP